MPRIPLDVSDELDLDLRAFCEVFFAANRSEVIRRAIASFVERELDDTDRRDEFLAVRQRLGGEPLRLLADAEDRDVAASDR